MIPKKLHYIWLGGGQMSTMMKDCMSTWAKVCPDYEIVKWDETNYDISKSHIVEQALKSKNWALAADVMRADILYKHGGIYLDTDIELLKSFDNLLHHSFFIGYEKKQWANNAVIGAEPNCQIFDTVLKAYHYDEQIHKDSNLMAVYSYSMAIQHLYNLVPNGKTIVLDSGIAVYSPEYFYPQNWLTGKLKLTPNTICIHKYASTWNTETHKKIKIFLRLISRTVGSKAVEMFENKFVKRLQKIVLKRIQEIDGATKKKDNKIVV